MNAHASLLSSVVGLVMWTHVMWLWMYATRLPAILSARMKMDPNAPRGEQMAQLPPRVRWKADNYNHLIEQPTLFYAVALVLALVSRDPAVDGAVAWTYVGIRVVHSFVQALINLIELRFALFVLSSLVLMALTVRAAMALMG